jgi:hypothetical protein
LRFHLNFLATVLFAASSLAFETSPPPAALIEENCSKAEAILEGRIVSSQTQPNQFTATKFKISQVYRGPFHANEELTYYSFRETAKRSNSELNTDRIIFLVNRTESGGEKKWGTVTDFSEFPSSPALRRQVKKCERKQP